MCNKCASLNSLVIISQSFENRGAVNTRVPEPNSSKRKFYNYWVRLVRKKANRYLPKTTTLPIKTSRESAGVFFQRSAIRRRDMHAILIRTLNV
jgi:hypothetical protein